MRLNPSDDSELRAPVRSILAHRGPFLLLRSMLHQPNIATKTVATLLMACHELVTERSCCQPCLPNRFTRHVFHKRPNAVDDARNLSPTCIRLHKKLQDACVFIGSPLNKEPPYHSELTIYKRGYRKRQLAERLLVKERKAGDELVIAVEASRDVVLAVVTEELKEGKHGKTSV